MQCAYLSYYISISQSEKTNANKLRYTNVTSLASVSSNFRFYENALQIKWPK